MRLIYWGLVFTALGVFFLESFSVPFENASTWALYEQPAACMALLIALIYISELAIFFNLPLATAIEAYRYLKGRKSELKRMNEAVDDKVDKFHEALMKKTYSKKI